MEKMGPTYRWRKILALVGIMALTVAFHYGWIVKPVIGEIRWIQAIHGRLCYIPIVIAASWFGLRGGLFAALAISVLILPFALGSGLEGRSLAQEFAEIAFYFAVAVLTGALVERELAIRRKHQDAQLQLERTQKLSLVGQLAAGVAHEIKNPLASIKGAVEILSDEGTSAAEKTEFKSIFFKEIKRIDGTIADFLKFARPKETSLEKLDLTRTLQNCFKQIEPHARRHGVSIELNNPENVFINGDREKIHQMTLNLIMNSIEASPAGSVIRIALSGVNGKMVRLTLTDMGAGIESKNLERVFEPFYTTKASGTGLGLAIVKSIVENHSGEIAINSYPGEGTTIVIVMPSYRG